MKKRKYKSVIMKRIWKSIRKLSLVLFVLVFSASLCFVAGTNSAFVDTENSTGNSFQAGTLNLVVASPESGLLPALSAADLKAGESVARTGNVSNAGTIPLKYKAEFLKVSGSNDLCAALQITAKKNSAGVFQGDLDNFIYNTGTLGAGNDDDWEFSVALPLTANKSLEKLECNFKFIFTAWQADFSVPTQGFTDEEMIDNNNIRSTDWAPIISAITASPPVPTKGGTNATMVRVNISWQTDENATSNVIYDTITHGTCSGYAANAPVPADTNADNTNHQVMLDNLLAGNTYRYRVVSEDSNHNETCSSQRSFTVPVSTTDAPSSDIVLNEFVPNPDGDDSANKPDGEWVELYNKSAADVGVAGWYIYDSTNSAGVMISNANTDTGSTTVASHSYLVVYLNKAYLNNDGDTVKLYSGLFGVGSLIDSHAYTVDALAGKSFARFPDGTGVWIDPENTLGAENKLSAAEKESFQKSTAEKCFVGKDINDSKEDICQREFLVYLGMLANKKDQTMKQDIFDKLYPSKDVILDEVIIDPILPETVPADPISSEIPADGIIVPADNAGNDGIIPADDSGENAEDINVAETAPEENIENTPKVVEDPVADEPVVKPAENITPEIKDEEIIPEVKEPEVQKEEEIKKEDAPKEEVKKEEPKEEPKEEASGIISEIFNLKIRQNFLC